MKPRSILLLSLLVLFIGIQFIRPARNEGEIYGPAHISKSLPVPENIETTLKAACYDCHSNRTVYPWYAGIQPAAWWLANHVEEGKEELNFSEFTAYSPKRQRHKLEEVAEMVREHEMPLKSYELLHPVAVLSAEQITELSNWAMQTRAQIKE